jgi:hypothetical protein
MDWHRLARALILGDDNQIGEREGRILRREILADGVVDREEAQFMVELWQAAADAHPPFDEFFCEIVQKGILRDGIVSDDEARWLRRVLFKDGRITPREAQLVEEINREAQSVGSEFIALYRECAAIRNP